MDIEGLRAIIIGGASGAGMGRSPSTTFVPWSISI